MENSSFAPSNPFVLSILTRVNFVSIRNAQNLIIICIFDSNVRTPSAIAKSSTYLKRGPNTDTYALSPTCVCE